MNLFQFLLIIIYVISGVFIIGNLIEFDTRRLTTIGWCFYLSTISLFLPIVLIMVFIMIVGYFSNYFVDIFKKYLFKGVENEKK